MGWPHRAAAPAPLSLRRLTTPRRNASSGIGAGFALEGAVPSFVPILLAQVVWGIGFTLTSGADVAWLADEVGERRAAGLFVRGAQLDQAGAFVGGAIGVLLGMASLRLPLLGGVLYLILAVALFQGAASEGFDRLSELHVLRGTAFPGSERDVANVALVFGVLNGVSLLLSIAATEVLKRTVDLETQRVLTRALSLSTPS